MKLRTRLQRLEQTTPEPVCPGCAHRHRIIDLYSQYRADGTIERLDADPQPCEVCGEIPETFIEFVWPYEPEHEAQQSTATA